MALENQDNPDYEVIVVDDGSTPPIRTNSEHSHVRLLRHERNRGLAAARNTGVRAATGHFVAFTDDDCVPPPNWLSALLAAASGPSTAVAHGGAVLPHSTRSLAQRYAEARGPLAPIEADGDSRGLLRRLTSYLREGWCPRRAEHDRAVASLVGANMIFDKQAITDVKLFDERITFGGEEEDLCRRLRARFGPECVQFHPRIVMSHKFRPEISDVWRRSRAYGRGNARTYLKSRAALPPLRPIPLLVLGLIGASARFRLALVLASLAPIALRPYWADPAKRHNLECLSFSYISVAEEFGALAGFVEGWLRYRSEYR